MQLVDLSKPGEKKKLIWAAALGFVAIVFLWWILIGFGNGKPPSTARATPTPTPQRTRPNVDNNASVTPEVSTLANFTEVRIEPSAYNAPEPKRNIFSYYLPAPPPTVA